MLDLIKLMDTYALDDRAFWLLTREKDGKAFEIYWSRRTSLQQWRLVNKESGEEVMLSSEAVEATLEQHGLDRETFMVELRRKVLTQAVFANMFLEKAKSTLGQNAITQAIREQEDFSNKLIEAIRSALGKEESRAPGSVVNQRSSAKAAEPVVRPNHLSLVRQ